MLAGNEMRREDSRSHTVTVPVAAAGMVAFLPSCFAAYSLKISASGESGDIPRISAGFTEWLVSSSTPSTISYYYSYI